MNIGENLRRYRRSADLTQDALARALGVSFQAISKWERGEGYPDITLLPAIAGFFKVSLDALFGEDEERRRAEIEELEREHWRRRRAGDDSAEACDSASDVYREALKKHPNDWEIVRLLADSLGGTRGDEQLSDGCLDEAATLYERIAEYATDEEMRIYAQASLVGTLFRMGDKRTYAEIAKLPRAIYSREAAMAYYTHGTAQLHNIQRCLRDYLTNVFTMTRFAAPTDTFVFEVDDDVFGYTNAERIRILQIGVNAIELTRDCGDYCLMPFRVSYYYRSMAELSLMDDAHEQALDYLERAADYAIENDTIPNGAVFTSVLQRTPDWSPPARREYGSATLELWGRLVFYPENLENLDETRRREREQLRKIRNHPRYSALVERLLPYLDAEQIRLAEAGT